MIRKVKFLLGFLVFGLIVLISCDKQDEKFVAPIHAPSFSIIKKEGNVFDGYIFLQKLDSAGMQFMINENAEVVWANVSDTSILRVFTPYPKSYLSLRSKEKLYEITYTGDTLLELTYGTNGFDRRLHHDVIKDSKNNIVAITHEEVIFDLTKFGGLENDTLKTDGILVLDRDGNKKWHWSFQQALDTMQVEGLTYFQIKNDWAHANAVYEDNDGNYLVSWRDLNQIWKINSTSGDVMWTYGGDMISDPRFQFKKQHGIHINKDGDYMLFDNGPDRRTMTSRGISFNIQDGKFVNKLSIPLPDSTFTIRQGSVYQFEEDKFLFSIPRSSDLIITNRKGDVLWHVKADVGFYRAYYLEPNVLD